MMRILSPCLKAQIVKELLSVLRDPRSRLILIGPPLIQLFVFSFAATLEVRNVDIGLYDRDNGRWSQDLAASLDAAEFVGQVRRVASRPALQEMIDKQQVIAGLDIPEDFSRRIAEGRTAEVQAIIDGRRANAGQVTLSYLTAVANGVGASLSVPPDVVAVRHWFNPNLIYQWFVVPSLSGILSMFVALMVTALSIARERELGTFDQLLVSPTSPMEIIIAKSVPAVMIGTALGLIMISAGVFVFGIPFSGSFALLLVCLLLFILSVVGIGLVISSLCMTQQQAILGAFAIGVPMILVSGFATPVDNMPVVLQWLAQAIPLTHFLIIVQGTFVKALPPSEVLANAWPMVVIATVTLSVSVLFVRGRLQ